MPGAEPRSAERSILSFAKDVATAGGSAAIGAAVGFPIFLGMGSIIFCSLPKMSDILLLPWAVIFGLIGGVIGSAFLRIGIGKVQRRRLWFFGFFLFGGVAGPLVLVALIVRVLGALPFVL
jgi:hypothetical protein